MHDHPWSCVTPVVVCDPQVGVFFRAELHHCITVPAVRTSLGNCAGGSVLHRAHAPNVSSFPSVITSNVVSMACLRLPTTFRVTDFVPASTSYTNAVELDFPAVASKESCSSSSSFSISWTRSVQVTEHLFHPHRLWFFAHCLRNVTAHKSHASCCTLLVVTQSI